MLNIENLDSLIKEIREGDYNQEIISQISNLYIKSSYSQKQEINNFIKDNSFLLQSIKEYLEVPKVVKLMSKDLKNVPEFYEIKLTEETDRVVNDKNLDLEFEIVLEAVDYEIASFVEKKEENSFSSKLSSLWDKSKKTFVASLVLSTILAPTTFTLANGVQWNALGNHFSFNSEKKDYAFIFNDGMAELGKINNKKVIQAIGSLTNSEMKFFIKNLEKNHGAEQLADKKILEIEEAIEHYYHYDVKNSYKIARSIKENADKYNIDPELFLAIMKVESDFKQEAFNPSGDFSVAQINYKIWSKQFEQLKKEPLDKEKLKTDINYSIEKMAEILEYLQSRYSKNDPIWYARYHNSKKQFKLPYAKKVNRELRTVSSLKMEKIADKILRIKEVAMENAENSQDIDQEKIAKLVSTLEEIHLEYSEFNLPNNKNMIAFNQE